MPESLLKKWSKFVSINGKFAVELPDDRSVLMPHAAEIPQLTYLAVDNGGHVLYYIKWADYGALIDGMDSKPNEWIEESWQLFLKQEADRALANVDARDVSTEFTEHNGYRAIRIKAVIGQGSAHEEVIIFDGRAAYSLAAMCGNGYKSDLQRMLNSFEIR